MSRAGYIPPWTDLSANEIDTTFIHGMVDGSSVHTPVVGVLLLLQLHNNRPVGTRTPHDNDPSCH